MGAAIRLVAYLRYHRARRDLGDGGRAWADGRRAAPLRRADGQEECAVLFGALGLWAGLAGGALPAWTFRIMGVLVPLAIVFNAAYAFAAA
jgi:hypothetical protein